MGIDVRKMAVYTQKPSQGSKKTAIIQEKISKNLLKYEKK
jgi:hypothetical protein